jgi:hypothetical protein
MFKAVPTEPNRTVIPLVRGPISRSVFALMSVKVVGDGGVTGAAVGSLTGAAVGLCTGAAVAVGLFCTRDTVGVGPVVDTTVNRTVTLLKTVPLPLVSEYEVAVTV